METALIAAGIQALDAADSDLSIIGTLFHDVGKIETLDDTAIARNTRELVEHDDLTLEILRGDLRA